MDYLFLRAWDSVIYEDEYLKNAHLQEAREMKAPEDAVFYDSVNSRWVTFPEVTNTTMINLVNKALKSPEKLCLQSET